MRLEQVAAVIRPRTPWEAVDLGFRMVQTWWRPVFGSWLLAVGPIWLLAAFFHDHPMVVLALWWLRPLFDRVPLHVVSQKLFGGEVTPFSTLRRLPGLWRGHLISALLLLRFDPSRSLTLAVPQLERLSGQAGRQRARVLRQEIRSTAVWLTLACITMEWCLTLALYGLIDFLTPASQTINGWASLWDYFFGEGNSLAGLILFITSFIAHTLVEPFYVAGGFALYLDRRTRLEGWDVELGFRRLARRLRGAKKFLPPTSERSGALLLLGLALGMSGIFGAPAHLDAQTTHSAREPPSESRPSEPPEAEIEAEVASTDPQFLIRQILEQEDFQTERARRVWRFRWDKDRAEDKGRQPPVWLAFLIDNLAAFAEALLWILVAGAMAYLIWQIIRRSKIQRALAEVEASESLTELDELHSRAPRCKEIPDDPPRAALALWKEGRSAEALGVLYGCALHWASRRPGLRIEESWTEADCVSYLQRHLDPPAGEYFATLTSAWQRAAFAHRPPEEEEMRRLCSAWQLHLPPQGKGGSA